MLNADDWNYEIEQAEEKTIRVNCAVEAYHCPVDETELCIIIGNLFDNAIEAVKDLPDEQRQNWISLYKIPM